MPGSRELEAFLLRREEDPKGIKGDGIPTESLLPRTEGIEPSALRKVM